MRSSGTHAPIIRTESILLIHPQPLPSFESFRGTNTQDCTYGYTIDKVQPACYSSRCQLKTRFELLAPTNRFRPPAFPALFASLFCSLGPKYLRHFLSFHRLADSFAKTPGWGVSLRSQRTGSTTSSFLGLAAAPSPPRHPSSGTLEPCRESRPCPLG